jgi:hypothetical protein
MNVCTEVSAWLLWRYAAFQRVPVETRTKPLREITIPSICLIGSPRGLRARR